MAIGEDHVDAIFPVGGIDGIGPIILGQALDGKHHLRGGPCFAEVGGLGHGGFERTASPEQIKRIVLGREQMGIAIADSGIARRVVPQRQSHLRIPVGKNARLRRRPAVDRLVLAAVLGVKSHQASVGQKDKGRVVMIVTLILRVKRDRGDAAGGVLHLARLDRAVLGDPARISFAVTAEGARAGEPTPGSIRSKIGIGFGRLGRMGRS